MAKSKEIQGLEELFYQYVIELTPEEGMLLDYVLTLHSFSESQLEWLLKPEMKTLRTQAGAIIIKQKSILGLDKEMLELLLTLIPITFRFGEEDIGYSLKVKLYQTYLGVVEDASKDGTADNTSGEAEGSTRTETEPL